MDAGRRRRGWGERGEDVVGVAGREVDGEPRDRLVGAEAANYLERVDEVQAPEEEDESGLRGRNVAVRVVFFREYGEPCCIDVAVNCMVRLMIFLHQGWNVFIV